MVKYCNKNKCTVIKPETLAVTEDNNSDRTIPKKIKDLDPNIQITLKGKKPILDIPVTSPSVVSDIFGKLSKKDREEINILHLDSKNKPVGIDRVSIGTLNSGISHPREIFKGAILNNANSIILVHNHPSGDPKPSEEDRAFYNEMKDAGELLNIKVLDSIVIGRKKFESLNDEE